MHTSGHENHESPSSISALTLLEVASCSLDFLGINVWQCLHRTFQNPVAGIKHSEWFPWSPSHFSHFILGFSKNAWWPSTLSRHLYISKDPIDLPTCDLSQYKIIVKSQRSYDIAYMWNLKKWYKWTYKQNRNRVTDVENKLMVTKGGRDRTGALWNQGVCWAKPLPWQTGHPK